MSDTRPSENQDDRPDFPEMKRRFAKGGYIKPAQLPVVDKIDDLLEQADHAEPSLGLKYAQMATVLAIREQTDALRKAVER